MAARRMGAMTTVTRLPDHAPGIDDNVQGYDHP
jgi:hypothetical protein